MKVLVLNCGSSSLKYQIVKMPKELQILEGEVQRVGIKTSLKSIIIHNGRSITLENSIDTHVKAFKTALIYIQENNTNLDLNFDFIAHRYVNAGSHIKGTTRITSDIISQLKNSLDIAPLHNPIIYNLIDYCFNKYSDIPQYIVMDHTFHENIPKEFSTYAIPKKLTLKYKIKRIGYHGLSHQYVMQQACTFLKTEIKNQKIISCHLGTGGSSICAIENGVSVNSSMGFTPLEGLIMNTRSGNIDIRIIFQTMYTNDLTVFEAEKLLNNESGILSILKESSDLREAIKNKNKNPNANLAVNMYVKRIKKYIGNYMIQLKQADVLIFTDTLGVNFPIIREYICKNMDYFKIEIDEFANNNYFNGIKDVSSKKSKVKILIIPTNEEIMIAREAYKKISKHVKIQ